MNPTIPPAFYKCHICRDEYTWPPEHLYWSSKYNYWVCDMCWDSEEHGEKGPRLSDVLNKPNT